MAFGVQRAVKAAEWGAAEKLLGFSAACCYVLGLLWAEGHLYPHTARVQLEMVAQDLEELLPVFKETGCWRESRRHRPKRKHQMTLSLVNLPFRRQLETWGYSNRLLGPERILGQLSRQQACFWWRGYFDGDGCLSWNANSKSLEFSGPYEQDWGFADQMARGEGNTSRVITPKGHRYSCYRITKRSAMVRALALFYEGEPPIGLSRKRKAAAEFKALPHGRQQSFAADQNPASKLGWGGAAEIRRLRADGWTQTAIAHLLGVGVSTVGRVCRNECWVPRGR